MPRIQTIYNQLAFIRIVQISIPLLSPIYIYNLYQKNKIKRFTPLKI